MQTNTLQRFTPRLASSAQFPVVQHQGTSYCLVPEPALRNLESNHTGRLVLFSCLGISAVAATVVLLANYLKPQVVTVEQPVIVERQIPVDTRCLAFCK